MSKSKQSVWPKLESRLTKLAASNFFLGVATVLFTAGAGWIAVSALYPGAFDEDTHLGLVKYFAAHPNPFFSSQPLYLDTFGAVVHSPQYLYELLMALPWRVITLITSNFTLQIILMRFINIGLFVLGIWLFRKVLLRISKNRALVNLSLVFFMLVPITSQLAGQINYDNLILPLLALNLLLVFDFLAKLKVSKFDIGRLVLLLAVGLLACLVKFAYLPILVAIFLFVATQVIRHARRGSLKFSAVRGSWQKLKTAQRTLLITILLLSSILFLERYGLNLVRYHTPLPDCAKVIGPDRCTANSIYQRNIAYRLDKPTVFNHNLIYFSYVWAKHMFFNDTMMINVASSGYAIGLPLPLPYFVFVGLMLSGLTLTITLANKLFRKSNLVVLALICGLYLATLLAVNYSEYLQTGRRVAVQGRYLVPVLPILFFIFLNAYELALKNYYKIKIGLATAAILGLLAGGGALTFVLHSDSSWYRPSRPIVSSNQSVQKILRPIIPGSSYKPYVQSSLEF